MPEPSLTIGLEEEYQLIDPKSRELLGYITQSVAHEVMQVHSCHADFDFAQRVRPGELQIETPLCANITEARAKLLRTRTKLLALGETYGFKVIAAGTHPFSSGSKANLAGPHATSDGADGADVPMSTEEIFAFGLQIHIGIEDRELAIATMRTMRYLLPHMLALSASSPFWEGRNTGLKSYRSVVRGALPRTGIPGTFESYQDYCAYVDLLIRTNSITDASQISYDITPHHQLPTLVVRICDMVPSFEDTLTLVALVQATVAWMVSLHQRNMAFRLYERTLIDENKWRAMRYGLSGYLIDLGQTKEVPVRELLTELHEYIEPFVERLHIEREIGRLAKMADFSSADVQLYLWEKVGQNSKAVVDYLMKEMENLG